MRRRRSLLLVLVLALGLLASCGSSDAASSGADRPLTTGGLPTTLLETSPVTIASSKRPAGVSARATGYEVAGTDGVWIEPNGDAVVVGCTVDDPSPAIRAAAIPGYRGIWTCT